MMRGKGKRAEGGSEGMREGVRREGREERREGWMHRTSDRHATVRTPRAVA